MNELLAIIIIVLICCGLFFAWLFSMAMCPDTLVNLISGTTSQHGSSSSNGNSSSASKELINSGSKSPTRREDDDSCGGSKPGSRASSTVSQVSNFLSRLNSQRSSNTSKKLSVVPEADEQLTVTSISQCMRQQQGTSGNGGKSNGHPPSSPQRASILPTSNKCRIIMEEPHQPPRDGIDPPPGMAMEDRCVEDVIDRQRNRRRFLLLNNSSAAAAKQEEEEETELCPDWLDVEAAGNGGGMVTADITPVPSRCITNPGSLVVEGEMGCSMEESKPLGRSAPAIVHVV